MKNEVYDILKWVGLVMLPALSVLVKTIGDAVGYPYTNVAVTVINALATFLGACLGVSTVRYHQADSDEADTETEQPATVTAPAQEQPKGDPDAIAANSQDDRTGDMGQHDTTANTATASAEKASDRDSAAHTDTDSTGTGLTEEQLQEIAGKVVKAVVSDLKGDK